MVVSKKYKQLMKQYGQAKDIVDPITWDYYDLVLNMGEK